MVQLVGIIRLAIVGDDQRNRYVPKPNVPLRNADWIEHKVVMNDHMVGDDTGNGTEKVLTRRTTQEDPWKLVPW